jgi:hypothetical protein
MLSYSCVNCGVSCDEVVCSPACDSELTAYLLAEAADEELFCRTQADAFYNCGDVCFANVLVDYRYMAELAASNVSVEVY